MTRYLGPRPRIAHRASRIAQIRVGAADLLSGVTILITLPLIPVFGALVGMATQGLRPAARCGLAPGAAIEAALGATLGAPRRVRCLHAVVPLPARYGHAR